MESGILALFAGDVFALWFTALGITLAISTGGFIYAFFAKRFDVADVLWGVGIAGAGGVLVIQTGFTTLASYALWCVLVLWGLRIVLHIGSRFISKDKEDARYAQWRNEWRKPNLRGFFQIFVLQGLLMTVIISPVIAFVAMPGEVALVQLVLGLLLWTLGFVFETVGDWQLRQFIKDPSRYGLERGDLMTRGLWSLTRHPNYFGEMTMWWGVALVVMHTLYLPYVVVAILGPVTITYLLRFVSGVPKTEEHWAERYGAQYQEYKESTPALLPKIRI